MAIRPHMIALIAAGAALLGMAAGGARGMSRRPVYRRRVWPVVGAPPPTVKGQYLNRRSGAHHHRGIDMIGAPGDRVYASDAGTVAHAGPQRPGFMGYGPQYVVIDHGGAWTLYGHLDGLRVKPGDRVERGDVIGLVAAGVTPPHLHFEVARHAYPMDSEAPRIDPVAWLRGEL